MLGEVRPDPARAANLAPPRLIVTYSPYRRLFAPLKQVLDDLQKAKPGRDIAVIVPELVGTRWYHYILHNQTAAFIKVYLHLSGYRRVVVINVPWYLDEGTSQPPAHPNETAPVHLATAEPQG